MRPPVLRWAEEVLETRIRDWTLDVKGPRQVLGLRAPDGRRFFCKRPATDEQWAAERRAYRRWTPALGDRAPQLIAADRERRLVLMTEVSGAVVPEPSSTVHRRAGALTARLHAASPPQRETPDQRRATVARLCAALGRAESHLPRAHVAYAHDALSRFDDVPLLDVVPCHGDLGPHNWHVSADGVGLVDFSDAGQHPAAADLLRLHYRLWWHRPRLADAFLRGYGRPLDADERAYLDARLPVTAAIAVGLAAERGYTADAVRGSERLTALVDGAPTRSRRLGRVRRGGADVAGRVDDLRRIAGAAPLAREA